MMRVIQLTEHIFYKCSDFTTGEICDETNGLVSLVCEGGLSICKICGEYEAGLDNPCVPLRFNTDERNWPEDFSQENGNYTNTCGCCNLTFIGNKHRRCCKLCGED
jgi:hypothetical protein